MMWTPSTLSARIPLPVTMEMASSKLRARKAPVGGWLFDKKQKNLAHKLMTKDITNYQYVIIIISNQI